ncbi:hypothetical protein V5O48_012295 [Marasmius crinis-equi]|uniref:Uncharacterized protein n=1 Tax=Marasmius crinis-equi TaxID=585013 RepID=A0ABR3F390_9AGAR
MHFVTSSLSLPAILASLFPSSKHTSMHGHFAYCLGWYIGQGKQPLDIEAFFTADTAHTVLEKPLKLQRIQLHRLCNQILSSLSSSRLSHTAMITSRTLYGARIAGDANFSVTELAGADKIDGILFLRTAGLTVKG